MVSYTRAILTSLFLTTFVISINPRVSANTVYTKADLEVLKKGKNYEEFFKHAKDIIPTQRDTSWLEMVSSMASEVVDEYRRKENFKQDHFTLIEKLALWPELANDEFFQVKRNSYSITYFKRCLLRSKKSPCYDSMKSFWKTARQDPETGFQLLELAEGFFPNKNSWTFIKKTVSSKFSKFYCQKELVQHTLEKRIRKFSELDFQSPSFSKQLLVLANGPCWKKAKDYLSEKLLQDLARNQKIIFYTLDSLNLLERHQKQTYLTKYFLEGATPGPLLNLAWTGLESMAQDYSLRKKVLSSLLELDPLPGDIFSKNRRHQTLTKHMVQNFPEYLNRYTKTCVNYLSGKKVYPFGNPTLNCHYLFKVNEKKTLGERIISQPLRIKYSGLMKNTIE